MVPEDQDHPVCRVVFSAVANEGSQGGRIGHAGVSAVFHQAQQASVFNFVNLVAGGADDVKVYNDAKLELTRANSAIENVQSALDAGKPSNEVDSRIEFAKEKLDTANKAYNNL